MPWYDATSIDISDKLRKCVTPSRPLGSIINSNQWSIVEPCLSLLPKNRPSTSRLLKSVEEYLVSVGPRDLSGQIDVPKGSTLKPQVGGYGAVYKGTWKRKIGSEVKVSFPGLYMSAV